METELVSDIPLDVSFWGLVMQADMVVKIVMLILLIASIWSWSIIFDKLKKFYSLKKQAQDFENAFWSGESLEELYKDQEESPFSPDTHMYNPDTFFGVLLFFEIISVLAIQKTRATRHFKAEVSNFLLRKFWVPS